MCCSVSILPAQQCIIVNLKTYRLSYHSEFNSILIEFHVILIVDWEGDTFFKMLSVNYFQSKNVFAMISMSYLKILED